jgi:predicted alpha/beta-fold hydrolase
MAFFSIRQRIINKIKHNFKPETWNKIVTVERDYIKMFKFVIKLSSISLLILLIHRQIRFFNTYDIEYVNTEQNKEIIKNILPIDYKPTFYLPSCLAQMIYNEIKTHPEINYKRELLETHDNGVISLDWVEKEDNTEKITKLLIILHGLTGGSESNYIKEIALAYNKLKDFKVVVVNYRGVSNTHLRTPSTYHIGFTEDIYHALKYIRSLYPDLRAYTLGTSMGANIFTKLFATCKEFDDYIRGFISVSNPLNAAEIERRLRGGVLDYFLIRRQLGFVEQHYETLKHVIGVLIFKFRYR